MAKFVCPTVSITKYLRGEIVENKPVNINLCKSISKDRFRWYPDNTGLPCLVFHGCDVQWVYKDEDVRDYDYNRIVNNIL